MIQQKVAIVTGASRGIGNEIAVRLAKDGCAVAMMGTSSEEKVAENIARVKNIGQPTLYIQGNIAQQHDRENLVRKVKEQFGRIDFLINNAGVAPKVRKDVLETTVDSFDYVLNINLKGTFFLTQLVAVEMIKEVKNDIGIHPMIINIASISSYTSSTQRAEYCISKAGISMITKLFADRLAEYGINVYEIRPGIIQTDMTKGVKEKYDKLIGEGITPIMRWGYPEDIANAVSAFCSGKFSFSTGEVVNVDGGFHLRRL